MITLPSCAKALDFERPLLPVAPTSPHFGQKTIRLASSAGACWAPCRKGLADWWGDRIAALLVDQVAQVGTGPVLNLASREYLAAVKGKLSGLRAIDIDFREPGHGGPRFVSFNAKRARGMTARWLREHRLTDGETRRGFDSDGYRFDADESQVGRRRLLRA